MSQIDYENVNLTLDINEQKLLIKEVQELKSAGIETNKILLTLPDTDISGLKKSGYSGRIFREETYNSSLSMWNVKFFIYDKSGRLI